MKFKGMDGIEMSIELKEGQKAPIFTLMDHVGRKVSLSNFKGSWVVLYFYPKDNTPGCSMEAKGFTAHMEEFKKANTVVLGVSADSVKSHCSFVERLGLKVILLSDPNKAICKKYGVIRDRNMFGRMLKLIGRATFLIDPKGNIDKVWDKVTVEGHPKKVLDRITQKEVINRLT